MCKVKAKELELRGQFEALKQKYQIMTTEEFADYIRLLEASVDSQEAEVSERLSTRVRRSFVKKGVLKEHYD